MFTCVSVLKHGRSEKYASTLFSRREVVSGLAHVYVVFRMLAERNG